MRDRTNNIGNQVGILTFKDILEFRLISDYYFHLRIRLRSEQSNC